MGSEGEPFSIYINAYYIYMYVALQLYIKYCTLEYIIRLYYTLHCIVYVEYMLYPIINSINTHDSTVLWQRELQSC